MPYNPIRNRQPERMRGEIIKMKQFESEKKFLFEYCSTYENDRIYRYVLRGRIFPKLDPYRLASFRIEIKIPLELPFKSPNGYFLDPIYHPVIYERGGRYCCCCWNLDPGAYRPTNSIVDYINAMINTIDNPDQ